MVKIKRCFITLFIYLYTKPTFSFISVYVNKKFQEESFSLCEQKLLFVRNVEAW